MIKYLITYKEFLNEDYKSHFIEFVKNVFDYKTPIFLNELNIKKGHILDNLPKNVKFIYVDKKLFEKENMAWGKVTQNKIAYHDRPIDDKYWSKMIDKGKEPLIIIDFDYENNQLRVLDGNHRLNVYINKGYNKIPTVLTTDAVEYVKDNYLKTI